MWAKLLEHVGQDASKIASKIASKMALSAMSSSPIQGQKRKEEKKGKEGRKGKKKTGKKEEKKEKEENKKGGGGNKKGGRNQGWSSWSWCLDSTSWSSCIGSICCISFRNLCLQLLVAVHQLLKLMELMELIHCPTKHWQDS